MSELLEKCTLAKDAGYKMVSVSTVTKDNALEAIANALVERADEIIAANNIDIENAKKNGTRQAMIDRLTLTKERIDGIAEGVRQVKALADPIGEVIKMWKRPNGLTIGQKRVPMGVIAIIYEARPNVTVDAAVLCLKTSNACILRGGSEAINSNKAVMKIMQDAAYGVGIPEGTLNIIEDTSRETATQLMKMNGYVDLLIPRGGKGLIRSVVENATVPVVETAAGNCHVYVDADADIDMAVKIVLNAKVQRPSVCNAAETLLIDKKIADKFIPVMFKALKEKNVEIRADQNSKAIFADVNDATDEDYYTEYNDYIMAVKVVDGIDEAIEHINKYNTKHSEAIVTNNYEHSQKFLNEVDAAAVYVNASTRFTDGFEFGFGAEIGISKGLIRSVVENATVPVVETAAGNCHVYVDADADIDMAVKIVLNAKVQRPSVCNAAETLLIDKKIADKFIPVMFKALKEKNVEIRADQNSKAIFADVNDATDEDYYTEYNDYIMAVKVVDGIDEAIEHINKYNTKHSEAIVTNNYEHSQKFLNEVDAAAVYVNASTRFTDGFEFGFGAEIGISTQKMHARGPMGLEALTSIKYIIYGDGQIRE